MDVQKSLDLDAVRAFVLVADLASFTRAADALQTAQAAVSLKIKKLEARLGHRLLDRTPRHVQLSPHGEGFIDVARDLLAVHDRALSANAKVHEARISIGISDHVAGPELPRVLQTLATYDPSISMEITVGASLDLLDAYEARGFDAVVFRREHGKRLGGFLFEEKVSWIASPEYKHGSDAPLRLATLSTSCGMRSLAINALNDAGISWRESFVGGGILAIGAAVSAGLAVTALATRLAPPGAIDVAQKFDLPRLPPSQVVAKTRKMGKRSRNAIQMFLATFGGPAIPH